MSERQNIAHGYFKTGEFAKICDVKKQTLFHYDDIGLFSPAIVDDKGYRYYSTNQIELFHVIQILRDLNMSLNEIKNYLDDRSAESLFDLFTKKSREIDKKVDELIWQKDYMKRKLAIIEEVLPKEKDIVLVEERDEEYFVATEYHGPDDERNIERGISKHLSYCESIDVYSSYMIGCMIPTDTVPTPKYYNYTHFYTKLDPKDVHKKTHTKPAGTYAAIYHVGGYDTIYDNYTKLVNFCTEKGYTIGNYFYENEIVNEMVVKKIRDFVIRIDVQIL